MSYFDSPGKKRTEILTPPLVVHPKAPNLRREHDGIILAWGLIKVKIDLHQGMLWFVVVLIILLVALMVCLHVDHVSWVYLAPLS